MEQKHVCCSSVYDRLPPLSANHSWFVAQNLEAEDDTEVQTFYTVDNPMYHYRCRIPKLLGKRIRGCFYGWVLLSSHPDNVKWTLWNPITSKVIHLPLLIPKGEDIDDIRYCCLSSPPEDPNSVILLTRTKKPIIIFCRLDRKRKKSKWTEMTYTRLVRNITNSEGLLHCLTCCNGKVYAVIKLYALAIGSHHLVEVDIKVYDTKVVINLLSVIEVPYPSYNDCSTLLPLLKGSCTELFTIVIGFKDDMRKIVGVVYLFKLDMTRTMWEEVQDLKDTVFSVELASDLSVFYSPAIASEIGGYIHILGEKGKMICSYHVKDKTMSLSCMPCLRTSHVSAWAMPIAESRLEGDHADFKQEEDKDAEMVVGSVQGDEVEFNSTAYEYQPLNTPYNFLDMIMEFCAGIKCLKFLPISCFGNEWRLEGDHTDYKQEEGDELVGSVNSDEVEFSTMTDESQSHLLNIPFHVLELIMEFCVSVEYLNFRATCKRCHLAAPMIQWGNGTSSKRLQAYSFVSPWLMVFDKHKGIINFTDPMFGNKYFIKTAQELICDFEIKSARYGWLLILKLGTPVLFNPFTSDIRVLPRLDFMDSFCFSSPPTSPDCMVVGFTTIGQWQVYIHFVAREPIWRRVSLNFGGEDPYSFHFPTFYNQDLYVLCKEGGVDVFKEIGNEDYSWATVVNEAPTSHCGSLPQHFLVRCDQHLLLVIVGEFGESVEVFKPNGDEEWEKIDGLGKHTIYISGATCLCVEAKAQEMENKIYFARLHSGNEKIVFYSFKTGMYHTFNGRNIQESFKDFFGTKHHLPPHAWIEPSWSS